MEESDAQFCASLFLLSVIITYFRKKSHVFYFDMKENGEKSRKS